MSFRIITLAEGGETCLRLDGRLDAQGVPVLRREIQPTKQVVILDLSGLTSADADGLQLLSELSAKGAKLQGASAYIRQLLGEARAVSPPEKTTE